MSRNRHSRTPSERHFTSAPSAMARFGSKQVDPVNVAVRLAFVLGPARMDAGVAAVERAVVPCEAMRIGIGFRKLDRLERPARFSVVLDQSRALIGSRHHPDRAVVPGRAVRARPGVGVEGFGLAWYVVVGEVATQAM